MTRRSATRWLWLTTSNQTINAPFSSLTHRNNWRNSTSLRWGSKSWLAFIGTITLGIGGIGLMNIMLVSVTQRHTRDRSREKRWARKKDIMFQFLAEAMVITAAGGVLGILLSVPGFVLSWIPDALQCDGAACRRRRYPADRGSQDSDDRGDHPGPGRRAERHVSRDAAANLDPIEALRLRMTGGRFGTLLLSLEMGLRVRPVGRGRLRALNMGPCAERVGAKRLKPSHSSRSS